jgi:hypothetical protein
MRGGTFRVSPMRLKSATDTLVESLRRVQAQTEAFALPLFVHVRM